MTPTRQDLVYEAINSATVPTFLMKEGVSFSSLPRAVVDLSEFAAHFYVLVEVLEEQELQLEKILAFDNMQDRPIMGTSDWQQYEVVLDVSENGVQIAFGILLAGKGQVWLDEVQLELVSTPVQHA